MINLYIIDYFKQNGSGLNTYIGQLVEGLSENNEIELRHIFVKSISYKTIEKKIHNNWTALYIPHEIATNNTSEQDEQLISYLKNEVEDKEEVIFHFNWINHAPFARLLKKQIDCITLLTKHCIPWRDFITDNYALFSYLNNKLLSNSKIDYLDRTLIREYLAYDAVDHVICVTQFAQNALQKMFNLSETKLTVVKNGLAIKDCEQNEIQVLKKKYGFNPTEKIVLFAGNINERKGVFDLVKAFEKVLDKKQNIRLVIAGNGDFVKIFRHIPKNWSKITLTGLLDTERLYDLYRISDIGVVPSYVEQCSYSVIEMMHHQLPLIIADVDGLSEIVPDDCGIKTPLILSETNAYIDQEKLANNILTLLRKCDKTREYAVKAKHYASTHFSAEKMVQETVDVYQKLLSSRKTGNLIDSEKKTTELVSVLLPVYNGEKYLKACIDSILCQSYLNFELIIINDCSTDKTNMIVKEYYDQRIVLINQEKNKGIVACLNMGLKVAKGKYIARIDADDMMHENRIYRQVQFLEKEENDDIGLIGSHHYVIDTKGKVVSLKQYPITNSEISTLVLFQNPFSHPSMMIRTSLLKKVGYSKKFPHVEDYHLWVKLLKKYKAANLSEYLTFYRVHDQKISVQNNKQQQESVTELLNEELANLGIEASVTELTIHLAISFGYGIKFFHTLEKVELLEKWLDKVLSAMKVRDRFTDLHLNKMKAHIKREYCQVY